MDSYSLGVLGRARHCTATLSRFLIVVLKATVDHLECVHLRLIWVSVGVDDDTHGVVGSNSENGPTYRSIPVRTGTLTPYFLLDPDKRVQRILRLNLSQLPGLD